MFNKNMFNKIFIWLTLLNKDMFCAKQRKCQGRIFDCEFYHADAWVCMSQVLIINFTVNTIYFIHYGILYVCSVHIEH